MDCKVCRKDGNLQLLIDGEPQALSAYMTYNPRSEEYAAFAKAGVQIFSMGVYVEIVGSTASAEFILFVRGIVKDRAYMTSHRWMRIWSAFAGRGRMPGSSSESIWTAPFGGIYAIRRSCFETTVGSLCVSLSSLWHGGDAMGTALCALIRHVEASHLGDNVIGYQRGRWQDGGMAVPFVFYWRIRGLQRKSIDNGLSSGFRSNTERFRI
ncbi:MAG: hypothetical protein ACLR23_29025 [Clostridia bacterium]